MQVKTNASSKTNAKKNSSQGRLELRRRIYNLYRRLVTTLKLSILVILLLLFTGNFKPLENYLLGHFYKFTSNSLELKLEEVNVEGRDKVSDKEIEEILSPYMHKSIFMADIYQIKSSLENLDWVESCTIERRYPDTIYISFSEKEAIAIWQDQGKLYLIDAFGDIITDKGVEKFEHLPVLVGGDAKIHAMELLSLLKDYPTLYKNFKAGIRYGGRRWNLRLKNDVEIKLPEHEHGRALDYVEKLLNDYDFYNLGIEVLDLRDPSRYYIQKSPGLR